MTKPFFAEEGRRTTLVWEANSWVGTPFHGHARRKGVGVDCVQLAAAIYLACGLMEDFEAGSYNLDGGSHEERSRVFEWVEKSGLFVRCAAQNPRIGDLLCFKNGRCAWHVGIMINEHQFVHALAHHCVTISMIDRTEPEYAKRLAAVYRPMAREVEVVSEPPLQHVRD